ncbi:hypothetical protein BBP40_000284 [Aspergillus hancockii]|nr:hypothetical protein BBP40_000284 [Aspergillus hancockii]
MSDSTAAPTRRQHKGLACEECRSRKLRCDMGEPQCGTCYNLNVPCITNTVRRPRGPRKGHVKILRSRIGGGYSSLLTSLERQLYENSKAQAGSNLDNVASIQQAVEADTLVKIDTREGSMEQDNAMNSRDSSEDCTSYLMDAQSLELPKWPSTIPLVDLDSGWGKQIGTLPESTYFSSEPAPSPPSNISKPASSICPLDAGVSPLELGSQALTPELLGNQLPVQMSVLECADLDDLFFERAYHFAPIINQHRYYTRANQEPEAGEPFTCLQHAMRTLAASMGSQFKGVLPLLYNHTCCILDAWEQNMPNEALPIELVQARLLLAIYEILKNNPRKGWISAGRCFHLVHLVKLDQIDNPNAWQTSSLSWVEIEERRRTFWTAYALDRYANLANSLPMTLNDQMILTRLPAPETAFRRQQAVKTEFLAQAMAKKSEQHLSPYAKSIVIVTILARCLSHRNQCNVERIMNPISQESLVRHRTLDNILSQEIQTTLSSLSADFEPCNPTFLFIDMMAQAAVLVLFTALSSVLDGADADVYGSYEKKASKAVERIHSQAQKLSQLGCFKVHPFTPIALFICAEFARSCKGLHHNSTQFTAISAALSDLAAANNLAGMLEHKLQRNPELIPVTRGL